ncbi:MAG: hypothetical protein WA906_10385 [Pacificimonas sp.]
MTAPATTFSLSTAWMQTQAFVGANAKRLVLPAAAFLFLPNVIALYFFPQAEELADLARPEILLPGIATSIVAVVGQIAIMVLALNPARSEAGALRTGFSYFVPAVLTTILTGLAVGIGAIFFILPGLFLAARLLLGLPIIALGETSPMTALSESYRLTGNGAWLRLLAGIMLIVLAAIFLTGVAQLVGGLIDATPPSLPTALTVAATSAVVATYTAVFAATSYKLLRAN